MKILRLLLLVLSCAFSSGMSVRGFEQDHVVYYIFDTHSVAVLDVYEEAGPDVVLPDVVFFEGKEYKVEGMDFLRQWHYKEMRSLTLGKYMCFMTGNITYDEIDLMEHYRSLPELESIHVSPENAAYEEHDGCLYEVHYSKEEEKWLELLLVPQKFRNTTLRIHSGTREISTFAIFNTKYIKSIEVPSSMEYLGFDGIKETKVRKISFDDKLLTNDQKKRHYLLDNPRLRELEFIRADSVICSHEAIPSYQNIVKISPLKGTQVLKRDAFNKCRFMFVDLPDIKDITDYHTLGQPQAIMLGDKNKVYDPIWDYTWLKLSYNWIDRNKPAIICINSWIPPTEIFGVDKKTNNWTIYVPEESVDTYKAHKYWGAVGEILPITDKLIPLVSEPELEIEQYLTHEYLWDVMPLGEAVAAERGDWASEDLSVATIDENGVLTAVGQGETTITFTLADTKGNLYTAESKVTVVENVSGVEEIEDESVAVAPEISVPDGVYDLHGRRVGDTPEGLAPGLYIVRHQGKTEKRLVR